MKTRKEDLVEEIHGFKVADPYRWLEADSTAEVQEWFKAQDTSARSTLESATPSSRIKKRLNSIFRVESTMLPVPRSGKYFFRKCLPDEELHSLYIKTGVDGVERKLLDPNALSEDRSAILAYFEPSDDGKLLAYQISNAGNDMASIAVLDVETGNKLRDFIPADIYPYISAWDKNGTGFWYTRRDANAPPGEDKFYKRIYFHKLGDDFTNDTLVFGDKLKKEDWPSLTRSLDGRYLVAAVSIYSEEKWRSEIFLFDSDHADKGFQPVVLKVPAQSEAMFHRDRLYLITNYKAKNWRLLSADLNSATSKKIDDWHEVIPETGDLLAFATPIQDSIFAYTIHNVASRLTRYSLAGKKLADIEFPAIGAVEEISYEDSEAGEFFFGFSSLVVPPTIYRFSLKENTYKLFNQIKIDVDFDAFVLEQQWFSSKDGTKIPMFLVHKKGIILDGNNPTLFYGYGGFNISELPYYIEYIIPFIEAGGIYARVTLRGGSEFGEEWHEAGRKENKQNVFDDFIGAIEYLIAKKYTNPAKVGVFGWSNGGLLTAVVTIQRPDLIKASIIGAPVIDMLRYHLFYGGRLWMQEYGSAEKKEELEYLLKYSPYHNVREIEQYPAVLIVTADGDDRVHPMHAYKMTAALQEKIGSKNPILLRVEQKAGHSGATATSKSIDRYGDILGFLFWQLGIK